MKINYFRYFLAIISFTSIATALLSLIINTTMGITFMEFVAMLAFGFGFGILFMIFYIEEVLPEENGIRKWIYSIKK